VAYILSEWYGATWPSLGLSRGTALLVEGLQNGMESREVELVTSILGGE
jgi:hypothetical protein